MNTQTANRFFKLRENGKKMAYRVYSHCLLKYLDSAKLCQKYQLQTLKTHWVTFRKKVFENEDNQIDGMQSMQSLKMGEHVIVFWVESGNRH